MLTSRIFHNMGPCCVAHLTLSFLLEISNLRVKSRIFQFQALWVSAASRHEEEGSSDVIALLPDYVLTNHVNGVTVTMFPPHEVLYGEVQRPSQQTQRSRVNKHTHLFSSKPRQTNPMFANSRKDLNKRTCEAPYTASRSCRKDLASGPLNPVPSSEGKNKTLFFFGGGGLPDTGKDNLQERPFPRSNKFMLLKKTGNSQHEKKSEHKPCGYSRVTFHAIK